MVAPVKCDRGTWGGAETGYNVANGKSWRRGRDPGRYRWKPEALEVRGEWELRGDDHVPKFDGKARETQRDPEERKTGNSHLGKLSYFWAIKAIPLFSNITFAFEEALVLELTEDVWRLGRSKLALCLGLIAQAAPTHTRSPTILPADKSLNWGWKCDWFSKAMETSTKNLILFSTLWGWKFWFSYPVLLIVLIVCILPGTKS